MLVRFWFNIAVLTLVAIANGTAAAPGAPPEAEAQRGSATAGVDHPTQMAARIDALLEAEWAASKIEPAPPATDGEFLRRAYLDLTGVIPRVAEVRAFLADDRPDKRTRLIDDLLASPRHATHMATTWRNRIVPLGLDAERSQEALGLQKWLRTRFANNLRYDNLVGELLLTIGGDELGPALYYQSNNLAPEKLAASSAELFLGLRLECAQCHDHPTAEWSQRDFWGLAAFFARVRAADDRNMMMRASYRIVDSDRGEVQLPGSSEVVPPKYPKGDAAADEPRRSRRAQLALWITSRDNRFFSRAAVNWAWAHLLGRPLVDSLDNFEAQLATTNARLLDELADYFVESSFDLQQLWRTLANTRVYQLSSQHPHPQAARPELFARWLAKPLSPEQLYDSLTVLAPRPPIGGQVAYSFDTAAGLEEAPERIEFVRRMRPPPGGVSEYRAGTLQVLMLMNGRTTAGVTAGDGSGLLGALAAPFLTSEDQVDAMFLAVLSRPPDSEEREACTKALSGATSEDEHHRALRDMLWALLNSTEFAFNH